MIKVLHFFVLINLLVSSLGLSVNVHICKIKGVSYTLFSEKEPCCSLGKSKTCSTAPVEEEQNSMKRKRCCSNKSQYGKLSVESVSVDKTINECSKPISYGDFTFFIQDEIHLEIFNKETLNALNYDAPPLNKGSLRVLYQSFLC